jgi:hypothetical protein
MSVPTPVPASPKARPTPARLPSSRRRDWIFRLVIVTALCAAGALAGWSFKCRLLPLQQQSRELTVAVSRLSTEVDALERQWPPVQQQEVSNRLAQAHAQLFGDQRALEVWLSQLKAQADLLHLETKTALGQSIPKLRGEEEVAVIPATISVEVHPALNDPAKASAYERVLRLTQRLTAPARRADLIELSAVAGTNSISSAGLVFHLWAGEGGKP